LKEKTVRMGRYYHCLIAGLPDLELNAGKAVPGLKKFRKELRAILHPDDYYLVSLLFYPYDHLNLLRFLYGDEEEPFHPLGNFSEEDFAEQKARWQSILEEEDVLPGYMAEAMVYFLEQEEKPGRLWMEKQLTEGYYHTLIQAGNEFLAKWAVYERDMNNLLTTLNARFPYPEDGLQLVGEGEVKEVLEKRIEQGKEIPLPPDPEYATEILERASSLSYDEREWEMDLRKWKTLEDMMFFYYFTIERILGYVIMLKMVARWQQLDAARGKEWVGKLIEGLRREAGEKMNR